MAGPGLLFIEQNAAVPKLNRPDRRLLRSHVMRGKNAGKRRSTRSQASPSQPVLPPRVLWNDFCLVTFPSQLDADSSKVMHRWFFDISDILFPPLFCAKADILKSTWANGVLVDEAYFHCTLAISASYLDFVQRKPAASPTALQHICKAYALVNRNLSSPQGVSDLGIAAVYTLAIYHQIHRQHVSGLVHLKGLYRMVQLRGGIAGLLKENLDLALKPLRIDVELAIQLGTHTLFQDHVYDIITKTSSSSGESAQQMMLDLVDFTNTLNGSARDGNSKMDPLGYTVTLITLFYRLLEGNPIKEPPPDSGDPYADAAHLSMLVCLTSLLPEYLTGNYSCSQLRHRLAGATKALRDEGQQTQFAGSESLVLWIFFISAATVLKPDENPWILPAIRESCARLLISDWSAVHQILSRFPWIGVLHDGPAKLLWSEAFHIK